jgi:hypothetical protein
MECRDEAVEAVAEGDAAGFGAVPLGGLLFAEAAISLNLRAVLAGAARIERWVENRVREGRWEVGVGSETQVSRGQEAQGVIVWPSAQRTFGGGAWWRSDSGACAGRGCSCIAKTR